MNQIFVTGMLRSGTSLAQTLLTNLPGAFVAYQPFHQLYVDVKRLFLLEHGMEDTLPLDDGTRSASERVQFTGWLAKRVFSAPEAEMLVALSTSGKGGSMRGWKPGSPGTGTFVEIRNDVHSSLVKQFQRTRLMTIGSKEILCEEYVQTLLDSGIRCVLVLRDPRGVIASANHGRYQEEVGDRYPLMMLIRLWRKSAAYWLKYRDHPMVFALRYEDLALDPDDCMDRLWTWLGGTPTARPRLAQAQLLDHFGSPWLGNSSFGDKPVVDGRSTANWHRTLRVEEQRFIAACTRWEMEKAGYVLPIDLGSEDIRGFAEDAQGVREGYLARHGFDESLRQAEMRRMSMLSGEPGAPWSTDALLFPELALPGTGGVR